MLRYRYTVALFFTLLGMQATAVFAESGGMSGYDGYSSTCADCHTGSPYINDTGASNTPTFTGSTSRAVSTGGAYSVRAGTSNALGNGFNAVVRDGAGTTIGAFSSLGTSVEAGTNNDVRHSTRVAAKFTFNFNWTAPATPGSYTMYACVNQVNADDTDGALDGPPLCGTRGITVTNASPTATTDTKSVSEDSSGGITFDVTSNDLDNDVGTQTLSVTGFTDGTTKGILTRIGNSFTYKPNSEFESLADGEDAAVQSFTYTLSDGFNTDTGTVNITVNGANDSPVVSVDTTPSYQELDPAVTLDSTIMVTDADATDRINRARVTITNYQAGEDVLACTGTLGAGKLTGITSCNFSAGTLTLGGVTTPANYAEALETVTYINTSLSPVTGDRTITFDVRDNSGVGMPSNTSATDTVTVTVSAVSTPPTITSFTGTEPFVENIAQPVTGAIGVSDPDSTVLNLATMTLTNNYESTEDLLVCPGSLPGGITCSYVAGGSTGVLTLTSATTDSYADFISAISSVDYDNSSEDPNESLRTITLTVRDDSSTTSNTLTKFISVQKVNDSPTSINEPVAKIATEESEYSFTFVAVDPDDNNDGTELTYSIFSGAEAGMVISNTAPDHGKFTWTPPRTNIFDDTYDIVIEATDGDIGSTPIQTVTITLTVSPPDGDVDGVSDYSDNCPSDSNGALDTDNQGDNDTDTQYIANAGFPAIGDVDTSDATTGGDACDTDDDNDTISDVDELLFPTCLDKDNAADATEDCDGDGIDNATEVNDGDPDTVPDVDSVGPTVNAPSDITVDATGLLTVVKLGSANGNDGNDGEVTIIKAAVDLDAGQIAALEAQITGCELLATYVTDIGPFSPGAHLVTWASCDSKGNSGHDEQVVNVKPLVSVSAGQSVGEGQPVSINVVLNGDAIDYPASVKYSLSGGTATAVDHDGSAGTVVFAAKGDVGVISFNTIADGVTESDETVLVTLFAPTHIALSNTKMHTVTITESNVAPQVALDASQGGNIIGNTFYKPDGTVTIVADANDANGDTLSFDWSATDPVLLGAATVSANQIDIDASSVALISGDLYNVSVTVSDGSLPVTIERLLLVKTAEVVVLAAVDSDGDGFNDDDISERFADDDADGVPNYLDNRFAPSNVIESHKVTLDSSVLIETNPGLRIVKGEIAVAAQVDGIVIGMQDLIAHGGSGGSAVTNAATDHTFLSSLINFEIHGLTDAIESVHVVVPLSSSIQEGAVFRKYNSSGWFDFVIDDKNEIASTAGEDGACPQPGSSDYSAGLTTGHLCVQVIIQDGGANDADGVRNFIVKDPGGLALAPEPEEEVSSNASGRVGSVSMWFILILIASIAFIWRLRTLKKSVVKI